MAYRERTSAVPGVVLWQRDAGSRTPATGRILPDGCMDLIWDGSQLFVAGPDTRARWHVLGPTASYMGLRFSRGLGPGLLGFPADQVRDQSPDLSDLWPSAEARVLSERVATAPEEVLERWLVDRAAYHGYEPLGAAVFDLATRGATVSGMADRLGYSVRQLHRRCLQLFGYGPQHLARVLRFNRALAAARTGMPLAQVSARTGFADQAHLSREVRDLAGTTPAQLLRELGG
ncbi:MAG: helix-turn-helix domain-containing protein [Acidimicrobiales bacterium]